MKFDFRPIEKSKAEMRKHLAALPITEKMQLLDALRERGLAIRRAKLLPAKKPDVLTCLPGSAPGINPVR